jgi:6,7-dimethyl-8-ribityllumazine synthase
VTTHDLAPRGDGLHIAVAVARWNELVTRSLLTGAEETLRRYGVAPADIDVVWVPGSFELPQAARWLAETGRYDAIVCLGAVIRGATPHFDFIAGTAINGIAAVAASTGVPVTCGVLTTDTADQALERAGLKAGNKGNEAALAALELAQLRRVIGQAG